MSEEKHRVPLAHAEELAHEVVGLLSASCERIAIAGSIRRRRPDVGDIEIVCVPRIETQTRVVDLFGTEETEELDLLNARCVGLLPDGTLDNRLDKNGRVAFGAKYKRLLYQGFPLDVFSTTPDQWGVIFLLRTGPAEFNQQLVLKRSQGGWLTRGYFFKDGRLWKLPAPYDAELAEFARPVPTFEEEDVFAALGYAYVPPEERSGNRRPAVLG